MRSVFLTLLPQFILRYLGSPKSLEELYANHCHALDKELTEGQQQSTYYSAEQSGLSPACRVSPQNAADVSNIIRLAASASNIDSEGFTIDLGHLDAVALSEDRHTVSFGSGAKWSQVYSVLVPRKLTTVGGRASDVGVGGFLLGGGISFLSLEHGFGTTQTENPDLFWALKMGSTNYGIVTRFDMATFPLDDIWAGMMYFQIDEALPLLNSLVGFTKKLSEDPLAHAGSPPLFAEIKAIAPKALASTMRITNLTGMTDEVQATAPNGARAEWWSLTLEPNGQLPLDIQLKGREIFAPILDREGLSFAITLQPLNAGLAAGGKSGGNPSGITPQNGDSFLLLGCSFWVSPEDDEIVKQKTREHLAWAESTARERGLLKPFIYPNYANGIQDIFHGFGQQNLQKMRQVRDVYDPENVFGRYWRGGFKLGVDATKVLEKEL
ncbi:hypothetical protein B0H14DRAFT_2864261 [Mycena olivaceomarginata]|nr:hypothetical protein B0H14DRAFT_2864261 [Mycena olivaceomarginata]